MIVKEFFETRFDGVNLYRTYSDENFYIRQVETGNIYFEAVDIEDATYTYEETDEPIEKEEESDMSEIEEKAAAYDILMGVSE